jgi:hypothetical protein
MLRRSRAVHHLFEDEDEEKATIQDRMRASILIPLAHHTVDHHRCGQVRILRRVA